VVWSLPLTAGSGGPTSISCTASHLLASVRSWHTVVGVSTSRGYSYYFREMLSLCTLDVACCEPESEVIVIWGNPGGPQKEIRAKVAPAPYKTDNRKLDVHSLPPPKQVLQFSPTA
jgi:glycine cleavage system aminomethyltransferase T